jgi:hypothetical protein
MSAPRPLFLRVVLEMHCFLKRGALWLVPPLSALLARRTSVVSASPEVGVSIDLLSITLRSC